MKPDHSKFDQSGKLKKDIAGQGNGNIILNTSNVDIRFKLPSTANCLKFEG